MTSNVRELRPGRSAHSANNATLDTLEPMDGQKVQVRNAARALILDESDRLLLFRAIMISTRRAVWITPGGGLHEGETWEEAVAREIFEETGQRDLVVGPCVWVRSHTFEWEGRLLEQRERYFVVRCPTFDISRDHHTEEELTFLTEHRWWTVPELAGSKEYFSPRKIATFLPDVIAGRWGADPFDTGV